MTEYETIISKIDLLNGKLELYKNVSDDQIKSIRDEGKVYQDSIRSEIKAYQDANKQQLNVSLGVLVTAAIAILVSVIIGR
jgi:CHASE3 domain sensor protein